MEDGGVDYDRLDFNELDAYDTQERVAIQTESRVTDGTCVIEHSTDIGNARRFVLQHGDIVRHVEQLGGWHMWDGTRWTRDVTGHMYRLAKQTARSIWDEVALVENPDERKRIAQHAYRSESDPRIKAMLSLAWSELGIALMARDFDRDLFLLNVENGTLDLRTGGFKHHRREDLITKLAPVTYEPDAVCPTWDKFLRDIMDSNDDLVCFLQRAVGYTLTGDTSEQCLFLLHGTGANGKSTFIEVIRALLGDYAKQADFSTFLVRDQQAVRNDLARLLGARFVAAVEVEGGRRLAEAIVKQLTGGDTIAARFLFHEFFEFKPTFKLWLAANHKPRIKGTDYAIWRRIRLIPFTVTIPEDDQDKKLPERLRAELPGILRWAIEGCLSWHKQGLGEPDEVTAATAEYREQMDTLGAFITDCCVEEPNAEATAENLYEAYRGWCEQNGERIETQKAFGMALAERGLDGTGKNGRGRRVWRGIRLRDA